MPAEPAHVVRFNLARSDDGPVRFAGPGNVARGGAPGVYPLEPQPTPFVAGPVEKVIRATAPVAPAVGRVPEIPR